MDGLGPVAKRDSGFVRLQFAVKQPTGPGVDGSDLERRIDL